MSKGSETARNVRFSFFSAPVVRKSETVTIDNL